MAELVTTDEESGGLGFGDTGIRFLSSESSLSRVSVAGAKLRAAVGMITTLSEVQKANLAADNHAKDPSDVFDAPIVTTTAQGRPLPPPQKPPPPKPGKSKKGPVNVPLPPKKPPGKEKGAPSGLPPLVQDGEG